MKALVLAGGLGTRLRPFSHSAPKQLVQVANKPVLHYGLEALRDAGITEIGVIIGPRGADIRGSVGDGRELGVRLTWIQQDDPLGLAHCVRIAQPFLGLDDFVLYLGDNVVLGGIAEIVEAHHDQCPAATIMVGKVANLSAFGIADVGVDGKVAGVQEKPRNPVGNLAMIGVYVFSPAIHEAVHAIEPSLRGEYEITDAIQWLIDQGQVVRAQQFEGYWRDTGRVDDLLDCNRAVLESITSDIRGKVDDESRLAGPVVLGEGAKVVRSCVTGPAVVGPGTVVSDSYVGPYTSIGADCEIDRAGLDTSILLDGSAVRGVRDVRGSVIGRRAVVGSADALPSGRRIMVGDDSTIVI